MAQNLQYGDVKVDYFYLEPVYCTHIIIIHRTLVYTDAFAVGAPGIKLLKRYVLVNFVSPFLKYQSRV